VAGVDQSALDNFHVSPLERLSGLSRQGGYWEVQEFPPGPVDAEHQLAIPADDVQHLHEVEVIHFRFPPYLVRMQDSRTLPSIPFRNGPSKRLCADGPSATGHTFHLLLTTYHAQTTCQG